MAETGEARSACQRSRASDVARQTDPREIAPAPLAVHRVARRLGVSPAVAALVVQLAGLGPREARP